MHKNLQYISEKMCDFLSLIHFSNSDFVFQNKTFTITVSFKAMQTIL